MSSISFDNVYLLLLAIPLAALFIVPFALAVRRDNLNGHNAASGVMHIVMAIIIAFAAAGTSVVTTVTETDVYVLADVSYSATRNLDVVDGYINALGRNLPDNSRLGVICFGKDQKLTTRLGQRFSTVKNSGVDDSATDIVEALDFAGALFRDEVVKRIVVITDGKETDSSDANALKRQVDALKDRNIHVDAIYLDDNISDDAREVQLASVDYTQSVSLKSSSEATVSIRCSCPEYREGTNEAFTEEAVVTLYKNGTEYARKTAYLSRGNNAVRFSLDTSAQGVCDYRVTVSAVNDENANNNEYSFTQRVGGKNKVLLLSKNEGEQDLLALQRMLGDNAEIDAPTNLNKVPVSVEELCVYDEIVLSDVDAAQFNNYELFLDSLEAVVTLFGKSVVTFGNTFVQNYSAGELKKLNDMLPVNFGRSDDAPKLYTLLIDTSRSMETLYKLDRAKKAATEIVNMLTGNDMVAIVEFNGDAYTRYNPVPVSSDRDLILQTIENLAVRQGTNIGSGMQAALNLMKSGNYSEKRVMFISDGLNFTSDPTNATDVVKEMRDYDIFVSSLDVGRGADNGAASTTALSLLKDISALGGGSYLDITTDENLDSVVKNELPTDVGNLTGGVSYINVKRRTDDVLHGLKSEDFDGQFVMDYYKSTKNPNATTVLTANYTSTSSGKNKEAPLYAYWAYGNGRVATFTSNLSGVNVTFGLDENLRRTLFTNILETNTPTEKTEVPFLLEITSSDGRTAITLTPETIRAGADATVEITAPSGKTTTAPLAFGTSTFNYDFVTPDVGRYAIEVTYEYGGRTFNLERDYYLSYSPEYDSFTLYDAAVLHKMVGAGGTVSEDGNLKIENDASEVGIATLYLTLPLLIAAVVLYAVDIAVRKLKWEDIRSFFKRVKK